MFFLALAPRLKAASIRLEANMSARRSGLWPNPPSPRACSIVDGSPGAIRNKENCMIFRLETTMHPSA
jgi:hypothetical protein